MRGLEKLENKIEKLGRVGRHGKGSFGYSLIEVILAMAITGLVFISIYGLFASTMNYDQESRYEIIASNLAQEGIEIVRNRRDRNILDSRPINASFSDECAPIVENGITSCRPMVIANQGLELLESGQYQMCALGDVDCREEAVFSRSCRITDKQGDPATQFKVTCTVSWESAVLGDTREVILESVLTDWGAE